MDRYDAIIIGGGPAGLTAGIYLARARMKVLLLEKGVLGGQLTITDNIENYPGFPEGISGFDLVELMKNQAEGFGLKIAIERAREIVECRGPDGKVFFQVNTGKSYEALAVIIATGAEYKKLGVSGEKEFRGRGVSYCATCDAAFFRDKDIVVVGGGDSAVGEALFLTKFGRKVMLVHRRDRLRATKILQERAEANEKLEFVWDSVVTEVQGENKVSGVKVKNIKTGEESAIACDGVFVFVGFKPVTAGLQGVVDMNMGYIITGENMGTSRNGVFACGDCRKKTLLQVVTACGDGATAAFAARHYIEELKGIAYK